LSAERLVDGRRDQIDVLVQLRARARRSAASLKVVPGVTEAARDLVEVRGEAIALFPPRSTKGLAQS
jgi:hypothetical protein